jgi:hypothetical protein
MKEKQEISSSELSRNLSDGNYKIQLMSPVYNEGKQVIALYDKLISENINFDSLKFIYDFEGDSSLPYIEEISKKDNRVKAEKNNFGRGVLNALSWGFSIAENGPLIVIMADNSDKLSVIPSLIELWKSGACVVAPSRYMEGGNQHGGPPFKKFLSRTSGVFLKLIGFPVSDPTNNYKLYDGLWIKNQKIESSGGFEIALELTGKAFFQGKIIREVPTEWWDRTDGESKFKFWSWLPKYLRWYVPLVFFTPFLNLKRKCFGRGN